MRTAGGTRPLHRGEGRTPAGSRPGETEDGMRKKAYTTPTLARHGSALAMTRGRIGWALELINWRIG